MKQDIVKVNADNDIISPIDSLIERAAIDPNFSVDKLQSMFEMKLKHEANEARKAFTKSMSKFRSSCPSINKDKGVNFKSASGSTTKYDYASLAGTINQIKDLMAECGLSHSWRTDQREGMIHVTCIVSHDEGHQESTTLSAPHHDDKRMNYIQRIASTVSYLERYTLFAILGLASAEMDNDGMDSDDYKKEDANKRPTQKQINSVVRMLESKNELGFYIYLQKASNEMQISIFNSLPDLTKNKKIYREMEQNAGNIIERYSNDIENYAIAGDFISVSELISEIKGHDSLYKDVIDRLSPNCKSEINTLIKE